MAKKKAKNKSNGHKPPFLSPGKFMREKARTLPLGKCYLAPPDFVESGILHVVVTRVRPSGKLVMALFLVDMFCLGVKDAIYHDNMSPSDFEMHLNELKDRLGIKEISYNEAHNIIYGAIAFAEEGGIKPSKEFYPAGYILEEDTDDIPLIEYEFGKNGKHCLFVNPDRKEMPYFHILKQNLGDDFDFVMPFGAVFDEDEDEDDFFDDEDDAPSSKIDNETFKQLLLDGLRELQEEGELYPHEKYTYQYPDYPQTLSVKNQFIADELLSPDNYSCLTREVIDRILALPKDEAAQDIANVIYYVIGKTYKDINDNTIKSFDNSAIMHSLMLLAQIQSDKGLEAVLEIMRQNYLFADFHLGDIAPSLIHPALYACGQNNIPAIEAYMNQPGLDSYLRSTALDALTMIIVNQPERRGEIIEVFRRILINMSSNLPTQKACDGTLAGFVMISMINIVARELIPEIKATFATGCVNKMIAGDCKKVIRDIKQCRGTTSKDKYKIPDIYKEYESIKRFLMKPE